MAAKTTPDGTTRTRTHITDDDLDALARGCAIVSTGGGGDVHTQIPSARLALSEHGPVPLITLDDLADDDLVVPLSGIGAPTVSNEMPGSLEQTKKLRDLIEQTMGRPITAIMASEIGGANGVAPVAWAAELGLPLLDADGMGRAFPRVEQVSMYVAGLPVNYVALSDVVGNTAMISPVSGPWSERLARALCVASGASALMADYILPAKDARGAVIENTVSLSIRIGEAVAGATDPIAELERTLNARSLIHGKLIDVQRRTGEGFVRGTATIAGTGHDKGRLVQIEIQNENLIATEDGVVLATVPDLITVVDSATGTAIQTEMLRYGQRINVLAWPCHPLWRTPRGLEVAGPRAFGYDIDFTPVEELHA